MKEAQPKARATSNTTNSVAFPLPAVLAHEVNVVRRGLLTEPLGRGADGTSDQSNNAAVVPKSRPQTSNGAPSKRNSTGWNCLS